MVPRWVVRRWVILRRMTPRDASEAHAVHRTACNRDCPDACSLLLEVDEAGRPLHLRGDPDDPVTGGFLCERTSRFLDRQADPTRFTSPMLRRDGELVPVGWDEALGVAAEKLVAAKAEHGPASILHYRSGGSLGILRALADHLFEQFGPVTIKSGDICSGAGEAAQERDFGVADSHDLFDLRNSRTIVVWGKNPHTSGVHLLPVLLEARKRGARLVGIDPVRTKLEPLCESWLQPRPGGDYALAMGLARRLFDEGLTAPDAASRCDHLDAYRALVHERDVDGWAAEAEVDADALRRLAAEYAEGPTAILVGWGLVRRTHGASCVRALDALAAVSGQLGRAGGGVSYYYGRRTAYDTDFVRGLEVAPRAFPEHGLGRAILEARDPPVQVAWVTAGNPVAMLPDSASVQRALREVPFTVVVETHPTDTTDCADLVLPTLTLLEDDDLLGAYGNHWLRASKPALTPPDGCRHELAILQDLAARLGVGDALAGSVDDWKARITRRLSAEGVTPERLAQEPVRNPFAPEVLFADGRVPTESGRVDLLHEAPPVDGRPTAERPLLLMACSTPAAQSSQWSVEPESPPPARVHPDCAAGLADGALARVESELGELAVRVRHDDRVRPGLVLLPKGGRLRDGSCANLLIRARATDLGGGAAFYEEPVRLLPADGA